MESNEGPADNYIISIWLALVVFRREPEGTGAKVDSFYL